MTDYQIRRASAQDALQISKMMVAHAGHEGHQLNIEHQLVLLADLNNTPLYLYVVEDKSSDALFGYMSLVKQYSTWDMNWYLYLDCLYLDECVRGMKIGEALMNCGLNIAHSMGITLMQWQTPVDNTDAVKFYQKLGAELKAKYRFFWTAKSGNLHEE